MFTHVQTSRNFLYVLPVAVARFFSDENAIRYVGLLLVLWMTSCAHIMGQINIRTIGKLFTVTRRLPCLKVSVYNTMLLSSLSFSLVFSYCQTIISLDNSSLQCDDTLRKLYIACSLLRYLSRYIIYINWLTEHICASILYSCTSFHSSVLRFPSCHSPNISQILGTLDTYRPLFICICSEINSYMHILIARSLLCTLLCLVQCTLICFWN